MRGIPFCSATFADVVWTPSPGPEVLLILVAALILGVVIATVVLIRSIWKRKSKAGKGPDIEAEKADTEAVTDKDE